MTAAPLRVGTRGSALALWQTEQVRARLSASGHPTERVEIRTTGDMVQQVPLSRIGSSALFTRQIDDALLEGRIDLAVHSLKDLPTALPDGLVLAAVVERDDPRDALVGRGPLTWRDLPRGATLATSSLRRRAQLLHLRPDLIVAEIRGNVDTRLAKLDRNADWTGILLAAAGLLRLGLDGRIGERLPPEVMLPAPGQGALAVTARAGDDRTIAAARAAVHHPPTALAVAAERAFLRRLEGGCQVPVAALAGEVAGKAGVLALRGRVVSLGGERAVDGAEEGVAADASAADRLGVRLADRLLAEGGTEILAQVRSATGPAVSEP
ncbi:MAG TPA: hydroxymethylbilane synthase [Gemmatimonadales bacterium]|nr:hydroxymethylbilane synthase [Gemmatimonadales bacterium]